MLKSVGIILLASTSKSQSQLHDRKRSVRCSLFKLDWRSPVDYLSIVYFTNEKRYTFAPSAFDLTNNYVQTLKAKSCHGIAILARGFLTKI